MEYERQFKITLLKINSKGREQIIACEYFDTQDEVDEYLKSKGNPPNRYQQKAKITYTEES